MGTSRDHRLENRERMRAWKAWLTTFGEGENRKATIYFLLALAAAFLFGGLPMIGVAVNLPLGAIVLAVAFFLATKALWLWAGFSRFHRVLRWITVIVVGVLYLSWVGNQVWNQYEKDHPLLAFQFPVLPRPAPPRLPAVPVPSTSSASLLTNDGQIGKASVSGNTVTGQPSPDTPPIVHNGPTGKIRVLQENKNHVEYLPPGSPPTVEERLAMIGVWREMMAELNGMCSTQIGCTVSQVQTHIRQHRAYKLLKPFLSQPASSKIFGAADTSETVLLALESEVNRLEKVWATEANGKRQP